MTTKVAVNSMSRVYLTDGGARPDRQPVFQECLIAGGIEFGNGEVTRIECPDPNNYGRFIEVGVLRGATERPTLSLTGRYAQSLRSTLLALARKNCTVDLHIHFGLCDTPKSFNQFSKAMVLENATITSYSTEDLGSLSSDDVAAINETVEISASSLYELVEMNYSERGSDVTGVAVIALILADTSSCGGDCEEESDGCQKLYGVTLSPGGSPSTSPDVVFSQDGGQTWYSVEISTMATGENPTGIAKVGDSIVVVSNDTGSMHVADASEFSILGATPSWTEVGSGIAANDIFSVGNLAFIAANGGYVYSVEDPSVAPVAIESGVATTEDLLDVHALSETTAVAVGNNGAVIYTLDGELWSLVPTVPVAAQLNGVWMQTDRAWIVYTSTGRLFYTTNRGLSWSEKLFPGAGAGEIADVQFSSANNGFMSHTTAGGVGRILRTYNGGYSWVVAPEGSGNIPANGGIAALAVCPNEPNFVAGGGVASGSSDGYIVIGKYAE